MSPFFTSRRKVTSQALLQSSLSFQSNGCGKITQKSTPLDPPLPERTYRENTSQRARSDARRLRAAAATPSRPTREGAGSKFDSWHMLCPFEVPRKKRRDDGPIFALNSGRPGDDFKTTTQQSTIKTFQSVSWARACAMLWDLIHCGSHSITSCQRSFFDHFVSVFTWLIVAMIFSHAVPVRWS